MTPRVRGVNLEEDGKVTMSFRVASHALTDAKQRVGPHPGVVSALTSERRSPESGLKRWVPRR